MIERAHGLFRHYRHGLLPSVEEGFIGLGWGTMMGMLEEGNEDGRARGEVDSGREDTCALLILIRR